MPGAFLLLTVVSAGARNRLVVSWESDSKSDNNVLVRSAGPFIEARGARCA